MWSFVASYDLFIGIYINRWFIDLNRDIHAKPVNFYKH